jgi:tripartite-type tricarboxylate transporter receptor subunit TctC
MREQHLGTGGFMQIVPISAFSTLLTMFMAVWPAALHAEQTFPLKPVRFVTGASPGDTPDILARLIGPKMSEAWGHPVVIESRAGGGGIPAITMAAKSAPDGYTIIFVAPTFAIRAALMPDLPYDTLKDFTTLGEIGFSNTVLVAAPQLNIKTVKDFIAYANAHPGKVFMGSSGTGTATHLNGERFRSISGIKAQHVAFKGQSEFQIEIAAGRIQFGSTSLTAALGLIKDGKLQALALAQRTPLLPDVPSFAESLPNWGRNGTQGLVAPAGTPMAIRQLINRELARALASPDVKQRLDAMSFNIAFSTPEQHEKNLRNDIATFSKIVKEAGLRSN